MTAIAPSAIANEKGCLTCHEGIGPFPMVADLQKPQKKKLTPVHQKNSLVGAALKTSIRIRVRSGSLTKPAGFAIRVMAIHFLLVKFSSGLMVDSIISSERLFITAQQQAQNKRLDNC